MRVALVLLALAAVVVALPPHFAYQASAAYPAQFFAQRLDHFNPIDQRVFSQRYFANLDHATDSGFQVIYIGGEGALRTAPSTDFTAAIAAEFGAGLYALEHRFYGVSHPFDSLDTANLRYLTDQQSLADLASFIDAIDAQLHPDTHVAGHPRDQWIAVGGSYPGALSSWLRLKYPHMVAASLSSSGVVNAILDFTAFDDQIHEDAFSVDPDCKSGIRAAIASFERAMTLPATKAQLYELFNVTDPDMPIGDFFYMVADAVVMGFQYAHRAEVCDRIAPAFRAGSVVDAYASYVNDWWVPNMNPDGPQAYNGNWLATQPIDESYAGRQWWWQKSSRVAYLQNAPERESMRSSLYTTMDYHRDIFARLFGEGQFPDTAATNLEYGAVASAATHVFYANSFQDPWWHAGIAPTEENVECEAWLVSCDDGECGHCSDLHGDLDSDATDLRAERAAILAALHRWLD
jgi:hypothetical protein